MTSSTLDGYQPKPGDLVWEQMYRPSHPDWDSTIEERVAAGVTYGTRQRMIVVSVTPNYDCHTAARELGRDLPPKLVTKWVLQAEDPRERRGEFPYSSVGSDWCVLELIEEPSQGRLV